MPASSRARPTPPLVMGPHQLTTLTDRLRGLIRRSEFADAHRIRSRREPAGFCPTRDRARARRPAELGRERKLEYYTTSIASSRQDARLAGYSIEVDAQRRAAMVSSNHEQR